MGAGRNRSTQSHVVEGLRFFDAFKRGDIEACLDVLHPDIEWYSSPDVSPLAVHRGREDVWLAIQALYDRFSTDLELRPEYGRQVENQVLLITVLSGRNQFTKQSIRVRECWIVTLRDDRWVRVVEYPNGPVARLAFEELVGGR